MTKFSPSRRVIWRQGRALSLAVLITGAGIITGCGETTPLLQSARGEAQGQANPSSFAQFTDVPVPAGSNMDLERSLVLGDRESWIGRLVFSTPQNTGKTYDFFFAEMPRFGWAPVTTVRAGTSVLTYTRGDRAASIQISSRTLGGANVSLVVSPKGKGVRSLTSSDLEARPGGPVAIGPLR